MHVCRFGEPDPEEPRLCAYCLHLPGWHQDPELTRILGEAPKKERRKDENQNAE